MTNTVNRHGAGAYDYSPRHKLAQYAVTGCLSNTYYASADEQLNTVLELIPELDGEFVAKCAVYARRAGMKDVQRWLNDVSEYKLIQASVGTAPSLHDIVRMVHPKPKDETREAFYGWLLGKPVVAERLPAAVQSFIRYQSDRSQELPDVPFETSSSTLATL